MQREHVLIVRLPVDKSQTLGVHDAVQSNPGSSSVKASTSSILRSLWNVFGQDDSSIEVRDGSRRYRFRRWEPQKQHRAPCTRYMSVDIRYHCLLPHSAQVPASRGSRAKQGLKEEVHEEHLARRLKISRDTSSIFLPFFFNGRGAIMEKSPMGLDLTLMCSPLRQSRILTCEFLPTILQQDSRMVVKVTLIQISTIDSTELPLHNS